MKQRSDRSKKIQKPVSIRGNPKNFSRSKILLKLDSYLLKNKQVSLEISNIEETQNLNTIMKNKKILDSSLRTNLSKKTQSKIYDNYFQEEKQKNVKSQNFLNLKKILKTYFFQKILNEFQIVNLSPFEKKILTKILKIQNPENLTKIKIENILQNYFDNFLTKNFQSKILNFTRKLYKQVNKRMFKKFINKNKKKITGTEYLNKYLNFYFENPKNDLKIIINYCLFELKKKDVIVIFAFEKFTKKFDFELEGLFDEKWNLMWECVEKEDFGIVRDILAECAVVGFSSRYFKQVYEKVLRQ